MPTKITPLSKDANAWYNDVVLQADMADYGSVRGTMIIKPYGFAIWKRIQRVLGDAIEGAGVQDAYFPLLIPESFLKKEASHIEGFAPEVAWVTEAGGKKLQERLAVRPTSETIINDAFSRWIESHRDLPMRINQWVNVMRWEKRTKLFLRTSEFLWQEGHTVHAAPEEAAAETERALSMYKTFCRETLAIPVLTGHKTESEKFAGADYTLAIETLLKDGKSLQAGTSHNLGQNFAKVFDIKFADETGVRAVPWQTSWGMSSRIIGALILTHGDDKGLVLPPNIAPWQVVIVPIYKTDQEKKDVMASVDEVAKTLRKVDVRVHIDQRDGYSPGYKFNDWEVRGVPLRIEIGPKDVAKKSVMTVTRHTGDKTAMKIGALDKSIPEMLTKIQTSLLDNAQKYRDEHTLKVADYKEFKEAIEKGVLIDAGWCGEKIKEETKATIIILPFDQKTIPEACVGCGKPATHRAIFARAH